MLSTVIVIAAVAAVCALVTHLGTRARRRHERSVELAAAVAAADDPAFAPDAVRAQAETLYVAVQDARDRVDRAALAELLTPELFAEWRRRLDELDRRGWHNRVEVVGLDPVEYLGLVNRVEEREDRVTVRISATVRDYVVMCDGRLRWKTTMGLPERSSPDEQTHVSEYWTLAKCADGRGWLVASIESDEEGSHVLDAPVVAAPWNDDARLADASMLEVAALDRLPAGTSPSELVDLDYAGQARTAALDLSLIDGRWAPDALEAAVRGAVAAWAAAVDGRVVRGVEWFAASAVEQWTLALSGPGDRPWQIVDARLGTVTSGPYRVADEMSAAFRELQSAYDAIWDPRR